MRVSVARRRRARLYRAARLDEVRRGRRSRAALWRAVTLYLPALRGDRVWWRQFEALGFVLKAWSEI